MAISKNNSSKSCDFSTFFTKNPLHEYYWILKFFWGLLCSVLYFSFQFCGVAEMAIIHKKVSQIWLLKIEFKKKSLSIFGYLIEPSIEI